jgi:hypothetical protein
MNEHEVRVEIVAEYTHQENAEPEESRVTNAKDQTI